MGALSWRGRILAWAVGSGLALAAAEPATAQYSPRLQLPWVHDHVAGVLVGLELRDPIGSLPPQPAEGPRVIATRDWMVTAMAGIGANLNPPPDHDSHMLFQGHIGVMRRLSGDMEPRLGLVAVGYFPAQVGGPAARLELMDVAVIQAGWMIDSGLHVGVEAAARFLLDLAGK